MAHDELWSSRMLLIEQHGMDAKLAATLSKALDIEQVQEFCALSPEAMRERLSNALVEGERAKRDVEENESFQKAKQDVKYFTDALKDKVNPLKAVSTLMLYLLEKDSGMFE